MYVCVYVSCILLTLPQHCRVMTSKMIFHMVYDFGPNLHAISLTNENGWLKIFRLVFFIHLSQTFTQPFLFMRKSTFRLFLISGTNKMQGNRLKKEKQKQCYIICLAVVSHFYTKAQHLFELHFSFTMVGP